MNLPLIMNINQIKSYLKQDKSVSGFALDLSHPSHWELKVKSQEELVRFKKTNIMIFKYLRKSKDCKIFFRNWKAHNKIPKINFKQSLENLLDNSKSLGIRNHSLTEFRAHFVTQQGSIFWINLVKYVFAKFVEYLLNYTI